MPNYMSEAGLLAHLQIQARNIDDHAAAVGASAATVTAIKDDANNLQELLEYCAAADNFKTTIFGIKKVFLRGDKDDALGAFPDAPTLPALTLTAGVEQRSRERDQRFKRAEGVTEAARLALDLVDESGRVNPESVKPTIKLSEAGGDYEFNVEVSNKSDAEMFSVEVRRMNSEKWTEIKSGTGKSLTVSVVPAVPGQSERLEVRVQLIAKNADYGTPSDSQFVTVNP